MKKMRYVLLAGILCWMLAGVNAMAKEELGLAEEGSADAEALKEAHDADLQGAMEDPDEAEARTKWLHKHEGQESAPADEAEGGDEPESE